MLVRYKGVLISIELQNAFARIGSPLLHFYPTVKGFRFQPHNHAKKKKPRETKHCAKPTYHVMIHVLAGNASI